MKIQQIETYLQQQELDVAFINNPETIFYLSGYQSEPHERILALIITAKGENFLFTPALEVAEAQAIVDMSVYGYYDHENPWTIIQKEITQRTTGNNWAVEKNYLTLLLAEALQTVFPQVSFKNDLTESVQVMRLIKTTDEIAKMIQAGEWADFALQVGRDSLKVGITEAAVVAEIEYQLKQKGINKMSFDTLVLFGDHAASPHGTPGMRQIGRAHV